MNTRRHLSIILAVATATIALLSVSIAKAEVTGKCSNWHTHNAPFSSTEMFKTYNCVYWDNHTTTSVEIAQSNLHVDNTGEEAVVGGHSNNRHGDDSEVSGSMRSRYWWIYPGNDGIYTFSWSPHSECEKNGGDVVGFNSAWAIWAYQDIVGGWRNIFHTDASTVEQEPF